MYVYLYNKNNNNIIYRYTYEHWFFFRFFRYYFVLFFFFISLIAHTRVERKRDVIFDRNWVKRTSYTDLNHITIMLPTYYIVATLQLLKYVCFSTIFRRYEWLTLSGRAWTHVTASRWPKCCANSRVSARDCPRPQAIHPAATSVAAAAAAESAADPLSTRTATTR